MLKIGAIGRTYRHIQRYTEILGVLFKFGFGDLVTSLKVEQYLDIGRRVFSRKRTKTIETLTRAERLRMVVEELGPTFIKLGQMLSTRPDLIPIEFIRELEKLQDKVQPFPFSEAKGIIESELDCEFTEAYAHIHPRPLAAASIGQVHRARLNSGEEVVIKVQRPGIGRIIDVDLEILLHLAGLIEKHVEGWDIHRPTAIVEEFRRTLDRELDYRMEAGNMERLSGIFLNDPRVYIPGVYREVTTARVLTMEYVQGIKASYLDRLSDEGYDLIEIADRGAELIMIQTLEYGFFHADPHPGNVLILPENVICYLDMGMMGRVDRTTRENIIGLALGVIKREPAHLTKAILKLTEWEDEPDRRALGRDLTGFVDKYIHRPLKELELGAILQEVFEIAINHRLRVPPDLLLLIKALTTMEGLGRRMDPDFDIINKAAPFIKKVQMERYHPVRLAEDFLEYTSDLMEIAVETPGDIHSILKQARRGKFSIVLKHEGLEEMQLTEERTNNRLSFSIVLAALIVASSMIVNAGMPPTWHGIPIIGLTGFIVAGLMGFWLLISILKRGML